MYSLLSLLRHLEARVARVTTKNEEDSEEDSSEGAAMRAFNNPDTVSAIVKRIENAKAATKLARTNRNNRTAVDEEWGIYLGLCEYMHSLVLETRENKKRGMDVCMLKKDSYLIRPCIDAAMAYVNLDKHGAVVTALATSFTGDEFLRDDDRTVYVNMHGYDARITNPDQLKDYLSALEPDRIMNYLSAWDPDRKMNFLLATKPQIRLPGLRLVLEKEIIRPNDTTGPFNDTYFTKINDRSFSIWMNQHKFWQFVYYPPKNVWTTNGIVIMGTDSAAVWGFRFRTPGLEEDPTPETEDPTPETEDPTPHSLNSNTYPLISTVYSLKDGIRSSEELYEFITTYNWYDPNTAACVIPFYDRTLDGWMRPSTGSDTWERAAGRG